MKRKFTRSNHIPVAVGDTVLVEFRFGEKEQYQAVVNHVERRYGLINGGTTEEAPLLTAKRLEDGAEVHFDNGYIVQILKHSEHKAPPQNTFRRDRGLCLDRVRVSRGTWHGLLENLAEVALGKLDLELTREIDDNKLMWLFLKQEPGLISRTYSAPFFYFTVHRKPFEKWIRKNVNRILKTVAQVRKEETFENMEMEDDYWDDVRVETTRDLLGETDGAFYEDPPDSLDSMVFDY